LMIVFCCQNYTICLIDQAQRGFLFFLAVNQGNGFTLICNASDGIGVFLKLC